MIDNERRRFWGHVDVRGPDECWLWKASLHTGGYGNFNANRKKLRAHRYAYVITHGEVPPGLFVLHSCDVRACCNPAHLRVGTNAENMQDMVERGRGRGGGAARRKLTPRVVRAARKQVPRVSIKALARKHGVAIATMWKAIHGLSYKEVQP